MAKLTYEKICEKLGFDPLVNPSPREESIEFGADDRPSPYSFLTQEELLVLMDHYGRKKGYISAE
ncbi:MAG: hypothetical protein J6D36_08580 [Erysipelotrichaceae bacterium]|nr:hypothetical protein [Erysipelotrichaceae bacterium]